MKTEDTSIFLDNFLDKRTGKSKKKTMFLNKRSGYQMDEQIVHLNKELQRSFETITREQDTLKKRQRRRILLPLIQDLKNTARGGADSRLGGAWGKDHTSDGVDGGRLSTILGSRSSVSSSGICLPSHMNFEDEALRARVHNFLYGTNFDVRKREKPKNPKVSLPVIGVHMDSRPSQAQTHWRMIKDNLEYLVSAEKQNLLAQRSDFELSYSKLRSCRYLRRSRRQIENENTSNYYVDGDGDIEDRCFCNSCVLNIIKTNELCEKDVGSSRPSSSVVKKKK